MGVQDELYIMNHSFSADRQVQHQNRSGIEEGKASAIDFFASIQSTEADVIEAEEREEQAESKQKFAKLLLTYYKRIFTDVEFNFFIACIRENKTPYRVGISLGINYRNAYDSICRKHEANKDRLTALMRACGYDYRHGLDFFAPIRKRLRINDNSIKYRRSHWASVRERVRIYRETHRSEIAEHREEIVAKRRERYRAYYAKHRD